MTPSTIHSRDATHCLMPFSMARRLPTSSREGFGREPGAISILSAAYLPAARIGGGGFSLAPAVTSFGAVAGSSSQRADAIHGASLFVGDGLTGASMVPTPQTPGADGANRVNAGGIQ